MVQSKNKQLVRGALLIAVGLLLPYLFHGIKMQDQYFYQCIFQFL